jgi:hypothetical protein
LGVSLFLGGPSGGDGRYEISFFYKGLPVDEVLSGIKMGGNPPLQGGTIDMSTDGNWKSQEGEMFVHLPVTVLVKGTTVAIPKLGQTQLDSLMLPVNIFGPLDNPRVKVDTQAFSNFLLEAGKSVLQKKITAEIKKQIGGNLPANLLNERLQGLIPEGAGEKSFDKNGVGGFLEGLLPLPSENLKTKDDHTDQKEEGDKPEDSAKSLFKNLLNSR